MKKVWWGLSCLSLIVVLAACASQSGNQPLQTGTGNVGDHRDSQLVLRPTPTPFMAIPHQKATPTPAGVQGPPSSSSGCITFSNETTLVPAKNGGLAAPYGPAPTSSLAQQLAQQLFQLVNSDRAACGLPAFAWNDTLAAGALLHSWNMAHCGFSHTCPDGSTPYQRIANEGFAGLPDCGELIGGTVANWTSVASIQESMAHEPLGGWHRIHLFSTTLHRMGIGVYIDSSGYAWFTEDVVS
ncbi:MAG TPA: CAP domain-containing protein [Ktedonobacteraceae bacterium]|nr:CAP domain-containing protein [Ktedonobacteraceae bacterium]